MSILDNEGHDPNGLGNSATAITMRKIRAEIIEECAKCVPNTWLDPLLKGGEFKTNPDIEWLLQEVAKRIRALSPHEPSGAA